MRADFNNHSNNRITNSDMLRQAVTTAAIVGSVAYMTKVGVTNKLADKFEKSVTHKAAQKANRKFMPKIKQFTTIVLNKFTSLKEVISDKFNHIKDVVLKNNTISKIKNGVKGIITKIRTK